MIIIFLIWVLTLSKGATRACSKTSKGFELLKLTAKSKVLKNSKKSRKVTEFEELKRVRTLSFKNDNFDWKIYRPRKLSNGKVMMATTPHPVGTEFVLKTIHVRNLNFQKGGFLNYFLDGLNHRNFQKQCDCSKPSGKFADLAQFRSL